MHKKKKESEDTKSSKDSKSHHRSSLPTLVEGAGAQSIPLTSSSSSGSLRHHRASTLSTLPSSSATPKPGVSATGVPTGNDLDTIDCGFDFISFLRIFLFAAAIAFF